MDLTYATIVVLASMIFVLSGMVGYIYWQQTRLQQHIQSLSIIVSSIMTPPAPPVEEEEAEETQEQEIPTTEDEEEEDDRVSVEHVEAPPSADSVDVDDLQTKTAVQLRELLTQKGIPFGKRDSKTVLIELLKATA
jgi:hypothetical protein